MYIAPKLQRGVSETQSDCFRPKFEQKSAVTLKWYERGCQLVLITICINHYI